MSLLFRNKREKVKVGSIIASNELFEQICSEEYTSLADSPEVQTVIKAIAKLVSSMTIHLMQNTEKGDKRIKNGLSRKIDIEPYSLANRKIFIEYLVTQMILEGNAYVHPKFGSEKDGKLLEDLIPFNTREYVMFDTKKGFLIRGPRGEYNHDAILNFVLNPEMGRIYKGQGYKIMLRELIKNIQQARATTNSFMRSNFMPSVIVKVDASNEDLLSPQGRETLKERLLPSSKGEPAIIPSDIVDIEVIKPLSLKDIAIHETVKLDKVAIANLLGVPTFLVGDGDFNKEEFNNFISTTIREFAQIIEQELTNKLLISKDMYFRMSIRSLYAYSLTELIKSGAIMVQNAAMYRNEWRDWAGLEYKEEMEELILLENYIPADKIGEQEKLKGDE